MIPIHRRTLFKNHQKVLCAVDYVRWGSLQCFNKPSLCSVHAAMVVCSLHLVAINSHRHTNTRIGIMDGLIYNSFYSCLTLGIVLFQELKGQIVYSMSGDHNGSLNKRLLLSVLCIDNQDLKKKNVQVKDEFCSVGFVFGNYSFLVLSFIFVVYIENIALD